MVIEIERKYLVTSNCWQDEARNCLHITDHLIASFATGKARIRVCNEKATLTFKSARKGLARNEYHIDLAAQDAAEMIADFATAPAIRKHRHEVWHDGLIWQVDRYLGPLSGLITADVELPGAEHPVLVPAWAGEDITGDPRFSSGRLALALEEQGLLLETILADAGLSHVNRRRAS